MMPVVREKRLVNEEGSWEMGARDGPSLLESLRLMKYSFQSLGSVVASTAYPWFWLVIWQRPVVRSSAGIL